MPKKDDNGLSKNDIKFGIAIDKITAVSWDLRVAILSGKISVPKRTLYKVVDMTDEEVERFCLDLKK